MVAKLGKRSEILKQNYRRLREAGFSSAEATRFRGASEKEIQKVIAGKALPAIKKEKQQHGGKIKEISRKEWSSSAEINISLKGQSDTYMKNVYKFMQNEYKNGYTYFYMVYTVYLKDGTDQTAQTGMTAVNSLTSYEDLIDTIIKLKEELENDGSPPVDEEEVKKVEIDVRMWKVKQK